MSDDPIECLEFHLKKVVMKVYCGKGQEVVFARFFVLNAKVLERIEFGLLSDYRDEWRNCQYVELQLEHKASRDARFEFKRWFSWSYNKYYKKHIHDMSIADPFEASFLEEYDTLWEGIRVSYSNSKFVSCFYSTL